MLSAAQATAPGTSRDVQERWELRRSGRELAERDSDPKSVQLAAGSPRPTAADHIELSAAQILGSLGVVVNGRREFEVRPPVAPTTPPDQQ
jgi:hypothetical protein